MEKTNYYYAKVDGPPEDWYKLLVADEDGNVIKDLIEVNCNEGWAVAYDREAIEKGIWSTTLPTKTIYGYFELYRDEDQ